MQHPKRMAGGHRLRPLARGKLSSGESNIVSVPREEVSSKQPSSMHGLCFFNFSSYRSSHFLGVFPSQRVPLLVS